MRGRLRTLGPEIFYCLCYYSCDLYFQDSSPVFLLILFHIFFVIFWIFEILFILRLASWKINVVKIKERSDWPFTFGHSFLVVVFYFCFRVFTLFSSSAIFSWRRLIIKGGVYKMDLAKRIILPFPRLLSSSPPPLYFSRPAFLY